MHQFSCTGSLGGGIPILSLGPTKSWPIGYDNSVILRTANNVMNRIGRDNDAIAHTQLLCVKLSCCDTGEAGDDSSAGHDVGLPECSVVMGLVFCKPLNEFQFKTRNFIGRHQITDAINIGTAL